MEGCAAIDVDLDDIDDKEFDIPAVDKVPTLESILNAPDDDVGLVIQCAGGAPYHTPAAEQAGETSSISSHDDAIGDHANLTKHQPLYKTLRYTKHGAIIRHVILKVASAQLVSAADRVDAGLPTALAASLLMAVGTSHGIVLVFDSRQTLRWCLGGAAGVGAEFGAISALGLNGDCSRLLVGYAKGQVTMWDLTNGKLLRTVTDAHPPGVAVLHVKFTEDKTVAVMSDSGGSVFSLEFKRLIGVRTCDSQCLFSGSRGEVCVIEPLCMPHSHTVSAEQSSHPSRQALLLAMATLSKVLIVVMRPELKVRYVHALPGDAATLPLLAWHFVVIQLSDSEKVVDPVLAFARDQTVHFVQVMCRSVDDIKVVPLQKMDLSYKLLSISWLNSRTMLFIDTSERSHLIDVRSEDDIEALDLADVRLVFSTSFYKSLATGSNVSPALAYAGERACYQSIVTSGSQLVLLGTKGIHVLVLRTWNERLDLLLKQARYPEALSLSRSFYEGTAPCTIGLTSSVEKRHQIVAERIMAILAAYVDLAMTKLCPSHGKMEELEAYYQDVVGICVENCLLVKRTDYLFGHLYDQFSQDAIAKAMYLESLEPYILNDTLTSITPSVMKDFVDYYEQQGSLAAVEACIIHMDIASLDIHQVVSLCWTHGLYDAILFIYNSAMHDYTTPLQELLALLAAAVATGKQLTFDQVQLGNKILVYISCCLAGRAYPRDNIPADRVPVVKDQVLTCITMLHTSSSLESEPAYPHLRTLLHFDTREFFNVLSFGFEDSDLKLEKKQRIIDILLLLMVESVGFTPTQVGVLFTFLARQMARHGNDLVVNRTLFEQVLESLCMPTAPSSTGVEEGYRHEERQQAVLELYAAGGLNHFNPLRLLELAESAGFYRVCEVVYESRREFDRILSCYWRDPARSHTTIHYVQRVLADKTIAEEEKEKLRKAVLDSMEQLIRIDARRIAKLVLVTMRTPVDEVISKIGCEHEDAVFNFLTQVFEVVSTSIVDIPQTGIGPEVYERYVELMCRYSSPSDIVRFLQCSAGYRVEETIVICRRYNMVDAVVFLLEKSGKFDEAFSLSMESLGTCLVCENTDQWNSSELESRVFEAIGLLQRCSSRLESSDRERFWFHLLDSLVDASRSQNIRPSPKPSNNDSNKRSMSCVVKDSLEECLKLSTKHVINAMMCHVALPAILQRIVVTDGSGVAATFGNVRDLLSGVLESCAYERTLLDTCARLVHGDLHRAMASMTASVKRGTGLKYEHCAVCKRDLTGAGNTNTNNTNSLVSFRCGHAFHQLCLSNSLQLTSPSHREESSATHKLQCLICSRFEVQSQSKSSATTIRADLISTPDVPPESSSSSLSNAFTSVQLSSIQRLWSARRTPSRMAQLAELAQLDRTRHTQQQHHKPFTGSDGMLFNEINALRLAPPPPPAD